MGRGRDKRKRAGKQRQSAPVSKPQALPGDFPTSEPEASVPAPLKPKPGLRSGAVAVPGPEETEEEISVKSLWLR